MTDRVIYSSNVADIDIATSSPRPASPFIKNPIYSAQSEVRIVLVPYQPIDRDYVTISSAAAIRFLSRQFSGDTAQPTSRPSRTSSQILEDLRRIVAEAQTKLREVTGIQPEMLRDRKVMRAHMENVSRREEEYCYPVRPRW